MDSYTLPPLALLRQNSGRPRHFKSRMPNSFGLPLASAWLPGPDVPRYFPWVTIPISIRGRRWGNVLSIRRDPDEWLPPLQSLGLLPPSDGQPQRLPQQADDPLPRLASDANEPGEYPQSHYEDNLNTPEKDGEKRKKLWSARARHRKSYMCAVEGCGREYSWKENLKRHIKQ